MVVPPTAFTDLTDKAGLRTAMRRARRDYFSGLSPDVRIEREMALAFRVAALVAGDRIVGSYAAVRDEIDPRFIEAARIAFPRVTAEQLVFHACPRTALSPGYAGIGEPGADTPVVVPTAVLVPLVAVDLSGTRLGQGQGHYDRTLAALRATGRIVTIGLAWDIQIVSAIAADPWDQPLDWIATPERLVDCRAAR